MNVFKFENKTKISLNQYVILQILKQVPYMDASRLMVFILLLQSSHGVEGLSFTYTKGFGDSIECKELTDEINFLIKNKFLKLLDTQSTLRENKYTLQLSLSKYNQSYVYENKNIKDIIEKFKHIGTEMLGITVYEKLNGQYKSIGQKIHLVDSNNKFYLQNFEVNL